MTKKVLWRTRLGEYVAHGFRNAGIAERSVCRAMTRTTGVWVIADSGIRQCPKCLAGLMKNELEEVTEDGTD